jgi:hypothetical protein
MQRRQLRSLREMPHGQQRYARSASMSAMSGASSPRTSASL